MSKDINIQDNNAEQQRLIIALGIIAAAVGAYAIPDSANHAGLIIRSTITIQAVLAFFYVIATASNLKFKGSGSLFDIIITQKIRHWLYDISIEMFWASIFAVIIIPVINNSSSTIIWILGASITVLILALVVIGYINQQIKKRSAIIKRET